MLIKTNVVIDKNQISFRIGDDMEVYSTDINYFKTSSGLTIQNIEYPIEGYYLPLGEISKTFSCGSIISTLEAELENYDNILLVVDFNKVEEVGTNFFKNYTQFLLSTKNKVITINMSIDISNAFTDFIVKNIVQKTDEDTEEEE